jgi:hypothetical protein
MAVDWGDLPADTRRKLGGQAKARARARPTPERVARPSRTGGDTGWTYRCKTCGELTTDWAKAERHANSHGGGTTELLWPGRPPAGG